MTEYNDNKSVYGSIKNTKANIVKTDYLVDRGIRRPISNTIYFIIGFVIPIAGFIIYVVIKEERPRDAVFPLVASIIGGILILLNIFRPLLVM